MEAVIKAQNYVDEDYSELPMHGATPEKIVDMAMSAIKTHDLASITINGAYKGFKINVLINSTKENYRNNGE